MSNHFPADTLDITERLRLAVGRVMAISDLTAGDARQGFVSRFRGRLVTPSEQAFDLLDPIFSAEGVTLLFRKEEDTDVILAVPGVIQPEPSNPWVNAALFIATLGSMLLAGALYGNPGPVDPQAGLWDAIRANLGNGVLFAASLLGILVAHEFGHYIAARVHRTAVTLPYFLPFPGSLFGTLGAFIRLKEPPRNRNVLLDIGLAGPLAGLVVALPVLLFGLVTSEIGHLPADPQAWAGGGLEGNSLLYLAAKYLAKGQLLPQPLSYQGIPPVLYWLRFMFLGTPIPYGGTDVLLNHMAWAGWAGLLVTALNLIPAGQLDGGHTIFVLIGDRARRLLPFIVLALLLMGWVWPGWFIWALLIFLLGRAYARPRDEITPLTPGRRALAIFGIVLFILVFTPIPLRGF